METKRNNVLLAAVIFGAVFAAVGIFLLVWGITVLISDWLDADTATRIGNVFEYMRGNPFEAVFTLALIFIAIFAPLAFVFNLIGWLKSNNKFILIGGILYILSLNIFSAPLCLVEYFGAKLNFVKQHTLKRRLLFYTMLYTLIFSACLYFFWLVTSSFDGVVGAGIFWGAATVVGIVSNFFAWKTDRRVMKLVAAIAYVLGLFTIVPAIICFVCFGIHKNGRNLS